MIIWVSVVLKGIVIHVHCMSWMTESFTVNNNSP